MDTEHNRRENLALPQEPSSVPEIEVLEISPQEVSSGRLLKSASSPPQHTWLTVLKKEQEFLGFSISGVLAIISERRNATYLARGSLGANTASSIAGGTGITMLIINLRKSSAYMHIHSCQKLYETENCLVASFSTEIVVMMLFLTVLGFGSAVSLTVFGAGEELKGKKVKELEIYSLKIWPRFSEMFLPGNMSPPL
uniref:Membrane spanning 4-domains A2 n=1 Tax=Aotus nancymaae TaxID=37293 RepID=A0A2K5BUB2_AOTNA